MNNKEIEDLIALIRDTDVVEIEIERSGRKIRIRREGQRAPEPASTPAPPAPVPAPAAAPPLPAEASLPGNVAVVTAPLVGTFYRSPGPGTDVYVEPGDRVAKGQTLCIIEAMKLMNEIESEHAGVVRAVLADDGRPVEYGEPLFEIDLGA